MTRRYTLLDLLRDEPRTRETLSYRDLRLHRRANDGGRYNVGASDGERLCILDVADFDSEGALQKRLDDLSEEIESEPAVIAPDPTARPQIRADGSGIGHAFDHGDIVDVGRDLWPFGSMGTAGIAVLLGILAGVRIFPMGNILAAVIAGSLAVISVYLARAEGRRAYVEEVAE